MKTINTYYINYRDLKQFVETNSDILFANNNSAILVQVFSGICDKDFLIKLSKQIIELVPDAQVIGSTTSGEIMNGMTSELKTVLSFSVFQQCEIKTGFVVKLHMSDYELGRSIATALNVDKAKVLIIFATGLTVNSSQILKGVQSVNADLPVAGGNAADNFAYETGFVFCNETITDCGVVGVVLAGERLTVNHQWHLGWQPIGKEMTITKADNLRVYTIDNLPAIQIYKNYLGLNDGADIFNEAREFPLLASRSGVQIARIPQASYDDGSIGFHGDLVEGEQVRFSFAQVELISGTVDSLVQKIMQHPSESIFVYSCSCRIEFLKELTQVETIPLQEIAPVAGFFTYGEFFHADNNNLILNATMTALGLSELAIDENVKSKSEVSAYKPGLKIDNIKNNAEDRNLGVLKTLTHLVNTVTGELLREISERKQAEESLRTSRKTLSLAAEVARLGPWKYNVKTNMFEFSNEFYAIYDTDVAQEGAFMIPDVYAKEFVHPDDIWMVKEEVGKARSSTERFYSAKIEHRIIRRDGQVRIIEVRIIVERDADGQIIKWYGTNQDITELKQTEEALRISRETLSLAAGLARLGPWKFNLEKNLFEFGDEFYAIYGTNVALEGSFMTPEAYIREFVHPDDALMVEEDMHKEHSLIDTVHSGNIEHRIIRRDGVVRTVIVQLNRIKDDGGKIVKIYGANLDVTEQKQAEEAIRKKTEEIQRLAYTDSLTGLPNRTYLTKCLEEEMEKARRGKTSGVVLFIDLDNLKMVNDTFGHTYGDALIIMAGNRIVEQVGGGAFVGRISGDEFMAILPGKSYQQSIGPVIEGIIAALSQDIEVLGVRFHISASAGAAIYPKDGDTFEEIFKNADNAMYAAKKAGKNCWRFYETTMQAEAYEKMLLTNSLHHALERGELLLHYQPQVSVNSGTVVGFEALLRWYSQEYGPISPLNFIPLAEQSGIIQSIGEWVLREACRFVRRLADLGWGHIYVAVNVSPYQLRSDLFIETVRNALNDFGVAPCQLQLEITETVLMSSLEESTRRLSQLKAMGVRLALDDFGTGYSSLTYLQHLPVETLKIDKSFIKTIPVVGTRKAIIGNVVDMAHTMEMTVVAEGVETQEQFDYLARYGCDCIQGYLFSQPITEEEAVEFLP